MLPDRASGILLHPTSLPGPHGIGELGPEAFAFVDYLVQAKQRRWQVLPLGPTGYADSPYASFSSFAGNPLLISIELLIREGDLQEGSIDPVPTAFAGQRVDYGAVIAWKFPVLRLAAARFQQHASPERIARYREFCETQSEWLDDYALFMAIKNAFDQRAKLEGAPSSVWSEYWDRDIATRQPLAMEKWGEICKDEIELHKIWQFFFIEQWSHLKAYANERGIQIIGDLPIYVAMDSADVWASPKAFCLDEEGKPRLVAGVPPDYFSETGQRWGNPVYNWDQMQQDDFRWWIRRFQGTRALVDIIRVDHFRGFEAGWSIPANEPTAIHGSWVKAPGVELFREVYSQLGVLPILAEDLGLITPEVEHLRDANQFPGMRVLQFAFESGPGPNNHFLPHNYVPNCVAYTGTHDNDTTLGWYASRSKKQHDFLREYLGFEPRDVAWDMIRLAMASVAGLAIVPMQDVLRLGTEARMNLPASQRGNWAWRMSADYAHNDSALHLAKMVQLYDRQ
jgi:4-alpha-glucanotransferase